MPERSAPGRVLDAWGDPLGPGAATRLGTFLFLVLVVFAAFHDLGARSLHTLDLPRFGVLAREMIRSGEWLVPTRFGEVYANKPPLTIWLVAAPAAVFGEVTPFLVRLPSALGFAVLAVAASAWGRLRMGSPAAGRSAALLLLGTYALTRFGREGRPDMLAAGLCVAGGYLLDRSALGRGRGRDPWLAGVLLGLAVLAKGPAYLLVPLLVLLLPTTTTGTRRRLKDARPLLALGVAAGTALLWFLPAVAQGGWHYGRTLLFEQATTRIAGEANHAEPWSYYLVRLVDGGAPWSPLYVAVLLLLPSKRRLGDARSLVLAAFVTLVLFSAVPTKHVRYVLPVFALLGIGGGRLVLDLLERPAGRAWPKALAASAVAAALAASACAFAAHAKGVAIAPLLPPIVLLLLLAASALSAAALGTSPEAARRRVVGGLLVAVVLLTAAYWAVRDRYRIRTREAFDRAVAASLLPEVPLYTLHPVEPGQVFEAAPRARLARRPADLPGGPLQVVLRQEDRGAVEAHLGRSGRILLRQPARDGGGPVLLLGLDGQ